MNKNTNNNDDRVMKEHEEQVFDVWRKAPNYLPHYQMPTVYNHSTKWAGTSTGWGGGTRLVKGVYKCFADYLFVILKLKIASCGPDDDSVFIPTVEVLFYSSFCFLFFVLFVFFLFLCLFAVYVELLFDV